MPEKVLVPEEVKRQNRLVVTTKTVWWNRSVAVFVHDFQVLTLVHQTLTQLGNVELEAAPARNLHIGRMVIVKVFGNWYRARVERLYGKYASLTLVDVGRFLEKVPVRLLLDADNLCRTIAFSPEAEVFYIDRFHPLRYQIPDPEVLNRPKVKECISTNVWVEEGLDREHEEKIQLVPGTDWQFSVLNALYNAKRECFADRLEPLLGGITVPHRSTVSLLADVELHSSEEVLVVQIEGSFLGAQLTRFPTEELARLECGLSVLGENKLLPVADVSQENELVAVAWDEKFVRGRLVSSGMTTAEVYLVDYGISVPRRIANLSKLPLDIADRLPAFGLRVQIRNSASEIPVGNPLLLLSSIEIDNKTGIVTADVSPLEPLVGGENRISEKEHSVEESVQPETVVDETLTHGEAIVPSLENLPSESLTDNLTVDSFSSSQQAEPEISMSDSDAAFPTDSTMNQSVQSYLSTTELEDGSNVENSNGLELSNEFDPISNLCDIPPESYVTETLTSNGSCEAEPQGEPLPERDVVTDADVPDPELDINGGTSGLEQAPEKPMNGNEDPVPDWRQGAAVRTRDYRTPERSWREPRRDDNRSHSQSDWCRSTPKRNNPIPTRGESDQPHRVQVSRNDRRSVSSRAPEADSWRGDEANSGNSHRRAMSHPRNRYPGSGRIPREPSTDSFQAPEISEAVPSPNDETSDFNRNLRSKPEFSERSRDVEQNGGEKSTATHKEPLEQGNVASPPSFSVECVLEEKGGFFLGVHKVRKQSIERLLSELSVDSLQEIPLRRLKIDQLVLLEHMQGLVRGRVVEITRHKIELRLVDQHGVCSASRVFVCPVALADPETALQEIQLKHPDEDLHCGDTVRVIQGEQRDGDRLVVSRHEIRGKKREVNSH